MKRYVLGFAFNRNKTHIVLIKKNKPDWQKGLLNGVGGKIDFEDLSPIGAMVREFEEETGVHTEDGMWHHFATMKFKEAEVYCFRMFSHVIYQCKTVEDEEIFISNLADIPGNMIQNLHTLIPMAENEDLNYCEINHTF